jgi:hypothetical protein
MKVHIDRKKLGFALIDIGTTILKSSIKLNHYYLIKSIISDIKLATYEKIDAVPITNKQLEKITKDLNINPWLWDSKFYTFKLDDWKKVVTNDFNDKLKYLSERFDCDNFAKLFSSIINIVFGVNTCGVALGAIIDKESKEETGYHAYNAIPLDNTLYIFEPQGNTFKPASKETDMGWSIYRTDIVIYG